MNEELKKLVYLLAFIVCCGGVAVGMVLGLMGIWVEDFGETGWRLFLSDAVVTIAALIIAGLTSEFWKDRSKETK